MEWRNTRSGYGAVHIALHWAIAAGILFMLGLGLTMSDLEDTDPSKFGLYQLHKSIGLTIFAFVILRALWAVFDRKPELPPDMPAWQATAAKATHILLYALMILLPLTGWAMVSASPLGIPTLWFDQVRVPHLPVSELFGTAKETEDMFRTWHDIAGKLLMAVLLLHAGAALYHHFYRRDAVLIRMISAGPAKRGL